MVYLYIVIHNKLLEQNMTPKIDFNCVKHLKIKQQFPRYLLRD